MSGKSKSKKKVPGTKGSEEACSIDIPKEANSRSKESNDLYDNVIKFIDKDRVTKDVFERFLYSHDVAPLPKMMQLGFKFTPDLVIRPKSAEEISKIIKFGIKNHVPIIPRGGASWGLGGAVPVEGGIVLDITNLNKISKVDEDNLCVVAEGGVNWKMLYDTLMNENYFIGSYPSSAYAATVGGWVNTGGIGIGSYKYGSAGEQIRSLEVVLPDGSIINTGFDNVLANSSGYNLNGLFLGSEGTLGIITKATLKVYPAPEELRPLSYDFKNEEDMCKAIKEITRSRITPLHMNFLDSNHFKYLEKLGHKGPEVKGIMLNFALEGDKFILDYEEKVLDKLMKSHNAVKQSAKTASHEWDERFFEMRTKRAGPTLILSEAMAPVSSMPEMIKGIRAIYKKMKLNGAITGNVSDNNSVAFMPYYLTDERNVVKSLLSMAFTKKLADLSFKNGGRPMGLGIFFASNLKKLHGSGIGLMHDIKAAADPYNILNPGKVNEGMTRFGMPIPSIAMDAGMTAMGLVKGVLGKDRLKQ